MTQISLLSCLVICSTIWSSPLVTRVIREREGSSVLATVRLSILNPRPLESPATRARTPRSLSTRIEIVWSMDTHGECKVSRRRQQTKRIFSPPHYPHLAPSRLLDQEGGDLFYAAGCRWRDRISIIRSFPASFCF